MKEYLESGNGKAYTFCNGVCDFLISYDTVVCSVDVEDDIIVGTTFNRYWDDYSLTTMKHINEFRVQHGHAKLTKKEWLALPVVELKYYNE